MEPTIIETVEGIIGVKLHPAPEYPDKLTGLMVVKTGMPKFAMDGEVLVGLNLAGIELTDDKLNQILEKVDTSLLEGLNLSSNNLKEVSLSTKDFSALKHLEICNNESLHEIIFPSELRMIIRLIIRDNQLKRLNLSENLPAVRFIDGSRNKIKKLVLGKEMPSLEYMDWSGNELEEFSIPAIYPKMEYLYLMDSEPENIPKEVYADKKNCWEDVGNYFRELIKDKEANITNINYRAKLIVVGNGRVGKTSMLRKIKGENLNPAEPFTHGVQLGALAKKDLVDVKTPELELNVWDFGGQEIFYATHQFFLSDEAVYILAWTNEENVKPHRERDKDKLPFDEVWRSNDYWLENIRLHGKESPIIMVQTNIDNTENKMSIEPSVEQEPFSAHCINFSALKDFGLSELKDVLANKLNNDIPMLGKPFPKSYEDVYQEVIQLKEKNQTISLRKFYSICDKKGISEGGEKSLLEYLNKVGVVIYFDRPLLRDTVYIDPDWLTNEVYKLINNDLRKRNGEIDNEYLIEILPSPAYDEQKRRQFIELLKNFYLVFEEGGSDGSGKGDPMFIAPQYLPEKLPRREQILFDTFFEEMSLQFIFRFPRFIPDNVLINFLSRYGPYSNKIYWKNGICFKNEKRVKSTVKYDDGTQSFWVYSENNEETNSLLKEICDAFTELSKNANAEISIDEGVTFVSMQELKINLEACRNNPDHSFYPTGGSGFIKVKDYFHLLDEEFFNRHLDKTTSENSHLAESGIPIYFSYAWKDKVEEGMELDDSLPNRETLVTDMYNSLTQSGFLIRRDKEGCGYGEYIDEFMKEIGKGELIIVFLSKKFLFSEYCMSELLLVAQRDFFGKKEFKQRILPIVVEKLELNDLKFKDQLMDYWKKKAKENKRYYKKHKDNLSDDEKDECKRIINISENFSRLTSRLKALNNGDINLYKRNNFAIIKDKIQERLSKVSYTNINDVALQQMLAAFEKLGDQLFEQFEKTETKIIKGIKKHLTESESIIIGKITTKIGVLSQDWQQDFSRVYQLINEKTISENKVKELNRELVIKMDQLPGNLKEQWQAIQAESNAIVDAKSKLKFNLHIIPGILSFEQEFEKEIPIFNWAKKWWGDNFKLNSETK